MIDKLWSDRENAFRSELKKMRKEAGLNQEELAFKLGKPQSFVSKYESGERQLKFLELESICYICSTSLHDFSKQFSIKYPMK